MTLITLINVFTVERGKEEEFIQLWNETALIMKSALGFIDTKLHRSLDPTAQFPLINVAHWESKEAWQQAIADNPTLHNWWQQIAIISEAHPSLYQVVKEY
jgi:heme oxygenase (mycobilin-producing)